MSIDDEFGSDHDVENRRRRRRVEFDDDAFSHEPYSSDSPNSSYVIDEPPIVRYWRERAFGTRTSDADKEADKPKEEPYRRRACYQC